MQTNKVFIAGNLTRDPELRYSPSGTAVAKIGIALNRKWKSKGDEEKEETAFIDATAFGKAAESFGEMRKGNNVAFEGRLKTEEWDDKNGGGKRSKLVVIVEGFPGLIVRPDVPKEEKAERPAAPEAAPAIDDSDSVPF